jgi:gamma-glutamyltranspeptidase / glutathione hydrolase
MKHLLPLVFCASLLSEQTPATATQGAVASVHPLATDAGMAALAAGGNAIDAALATALTLGAVDAHNSGVGGGCFILLHSATGKITCIDGREMAPAAASRDMHRRSGNGPCRSESRHVCEGGQSG